MIFRFRVTYEDHEDVFRDIDIRSNQSFLEFHSAIQQAISFDNSKPAWFHTSDDYWRKEEEIIAVNLPEEKKKGKKDTPPKKKTIADHVSHPHQRFLYVFDPEKEWTFQIELIKILNEDPKAQYPTCVKVSGTAPKQYKEVNLPPPPKEDEPEKKKDELEPEIPEELDIPDQDEDDAEAGPSAVDSPEEGIEESEIPEGEEEDPDAENDDAGEESFGMDEEEDR